MSQLCWCWWKLPLLSHGWNWSLTEHNIDRNVKKKRCKCANKWFMKAMNFIIRVLGRILRFTRVLPFLRTSQIPRCSAVLRIRPLNMYLQANSSFPVLNNLTYTAWWDPLPSVMTIPWRNLILFHFIQNFVHQYQINTEWV